MLDIISYSNKGTMRFWDQFLTQAITKGFMEEGALFLVKSWKLNRIFLDKRIRTAMSQGTKCEGTRHVQKKLNGLEWWRNTGFCFVNQSQNLFLVPFKRRVRPIYIYWYDICLAAVLPCSLILWLVVHWVVHLIILWECIFSYFRKVCNFF